MLLRWTEPAANDLTQICDYVEARGSPAAARRVVLSIHEGVSSLVRFPELRRSGRLPGIRELIFSGLPYLAIY